MSWGRKWQVPLPRQGIQSADGWSPQPGPGEAGAAAADARVGVSQAGVGGLGRKELLQEDHI